ncbi:MAG: hypothetical protein ACREMV_00070 [Gemmatimonadales bacterium]
MMRATGPAPAPRVPQARIDGLVKGEPQEDFALSDLAPGTYLLGAEIEGKRVYRSVAIEAGMLTWVEFRPDAH